MPDSFVEVKKGFPVDYSIRVYKEYFNFSAAHFMLFKNGERETLHGHNYRLKLKGEASTLDNDMVFDFILLKPLVRELCNNLDHRLIIPGENNALKITPHKENWEVTTPDDSFFSFPKKDVLILPIINSSVERLAEYFAKEIKRLMKERHGFEFKNLEIEMEESPGQSAVFSL